MEKSEESVIPRDLEKSIKNKNFGIFIGAGLSIGAGFPSWRNLLFELIDMVDKEKIIETPKILELKELADQPSKFLMVAEELKEILASDFARFIKNRFDNKQKQPTEIHKKIIKLNSSFVVTTNYDAMIEKAYINEYSDIIPTYTYKDAAEINYSIYENNFFLLKAHGDAVKAPQDIILTDKDYRNIIYNERGYQSVLHVIFSTFNILFLGVSLNDPEINLLLSFIHHIFHGGLPMHYALMPNTNLTKTEIARWKKDYNIKIIPYDPKNNYKELEYIIDQFLALDKQ